MSLPPITLLYPVHTLDKRLLFPAGAVLSAETLETLISSNMTSHQPLPLLRFGTVREDIVRFLGESPYSVIFDSQEQIAELLDLMETIHLIPPVLQSLEYFKRHDIHTYRHILNVSSLATLLAKDIVSDYRDQIRQTATGPTHDFGKICLPLPVLKKSGPLTRTERSIVEHHAAAGYALLSYYLRDTRNFATRVARDHHERVDGSGYPRGIRLEDLMVEIVAVSDVYDALISPRPYRGSAYNNRTAIEEITRMSERNEVGWEVVKALVARNRRAKLPYADCSVSLEKRGTPPPDNFYGIIIEESTDKKDPSQ